MAVYDTTGTQLLALYDTSGSAIAQAYDVLGNALLSGEEPEEPFVRKLVRYDTGMITTEWLDNARIQRDAVIEKYNQSNDAVPLFIQTDGHGRKNEGNKGCHNLAEATMRYIVNIQLGDYETYYDDGANPTSHAATSEGITNYIGVMGNHEFANNSSDDAQLADMATLIAGYVPANAVLGSQTYGCYKVIDTEKNVKYLVTQPHIPDENESAGFIWKIAGEQYEWLIDELESDDGYDIVILQHEPLNGTYVSTISNGSFTFNKSKMDMSAILYARKTKTSGSYTDSDGIAHNFDFTGCISELLCSFHGHSHVEAYMSKTTLGFPAYVANDFDNDCICAYGLIDRDNQKLFVYQFGKSFTNNVLVLDL